jgi:hypothetical protein
MLSCKEVSKLLSRACDTRLSWRERLAVRLHLLYCVGCARLRRQFEFLKRLTRHPLAGAAESVHLPAAARERLRAILNQTPSG